MKERKIKDILVSVFVGNRYAGLKNIDDQIRYLILNYIFMVAAIPLIFLGISLMRIDMVRTIIDFSLGSLLLIGLILMRTKIPYKAIPYAIVPLFGVYCLYLIYEGTLYFWTAVWIFTFPVIAIFLCQMTVGLIQSLVILCGAIAIMYLPIGTYMLVQIRIRMIVTYVLITSIAVIFERISIIKDRKEAALNGELAQERDIIQTMKDNIQQGIFLMDSDHKILPQYSKPLITILSYYDSELTGKNFLDILSASLDAKQLQTMKGYFAMILSKAKSQKVLESANPISELEYKVDNRYKNLTTKFQLIEQKEAQPVILGIIQDVTREKEFERELQIQREAQELELKNMFDVIQIDPLVFHDFIEDTEANFNYINSILQNSTLTTKQVLIKFFQNIHAIKANALILGLETFGKKLHSLEDEIKAVSSQDNIEVESVLDLALKLEIIMQEKDNYTKIIRKIEAYKTTNQVDTILINSLTKAVEKISSETQKRVEIKAGQVDRAILESKLRKPIKDILFQCLRNSIYHGVESVEERVQKNKKAQSLLVFSIKNIDGNAEVTFSDDGRGLDWDKIKKRYLSLHPEAKTINKNVLLSAIFSPEFSTSEETSMVAGRGVGLSLVKDLVKENGGTIKVDSSESGLTFKFIFPIPKAS